MLRLDWAICHQLTLLVASAAVPGAYHYASKSNISYYLNTSATSQQEAEQTCLDWGGHLAIFTSNATEQNEVEQFFVNSGALIPSYHEFYWIGLVADSEDSGFNWLDKTLPGLGEDKAYVHWGTNQPSYLDGEQTCAGANTSLAYSRAWGWQAAECGKRAPYICMRSSERLHPQRLAAWPLHVRPACLLMPTVQMSSTGKQQDDIRHPTPRSDHACAAAAAAAAEPKSARFRSFQSGNTYLLNTSLASRYQAESICKEQGGHVTSFTSITEQFEVENWFVQAGVLLPSFHRHYWLGLYIPQVRASPSKA